MSRRAWLIAAVVVVLLAGLGVGGWFYGPRLYVRFLAPVTPAGRITGVAKVDSFAPGGPGEVRAVAGYQLWVVHFKPLPGPAGTGGQESSLVWLGKAFLVDETGEKYSAGIIQEQYGGGGQSLTARALVFSIPQGRKPKKIQFGDAPPVRLPLLSAKPD